tara:strand:+ start:194 stop:544 length:351 start_codon:yes stop_codon:yes gene_type:complete
MNGKRKYPIRYRPRTCIANFNIYYYPHSTHKLLVSKNQRKVAKGMKDVKTIVCRLYPIVLDDEGESPTENLRMNLIKFIWKEKNIKDNLENHYAVVRDVDVISEGRICYRFDEFKH